MQPSVEGSLSRMAEYYVTVEDVYIVTHERLAYQGVITWRMSELEVIARIFGGPEIQCFEGTNFNIYDVAAYPPIRRQE